MSRAWPWPCPVELRAEDDDGLGAVQLAQAEAVERPDELDPEVAGEPLPLGPPAGAVHDHALPVAVHRVAGCRLGVAEPPQLRSRHGRRARDAVAVQDE